MSILSATILLLLAAPLPPLYAGGTQCGPGGCNGPVMQGSGTFNRLNEMGSGGTPAGGSASGGTFRVSSGCASCGKRPAAIEGAPLAMAAKGGGGGCAGGKCSRGGPIAQFFSALRGLFGGLCRSCRR